MYKRKGTCRVQDRPESPLYGDTGSGRKPDLPTSDTEYKPSVRLFGITIGSRSWDA